MIHCHACGRPLPHTPPETRACTPPTTVAKLERVLARHQLAYILPHGVACTCGAELAALNAPWDDATVAGEPLALAVHQLQELEAVTDRRTET